MNFDDEMEMDSDLIEALETWPRAINQDDSVEAAREVQTCGALMVQDILLDIQTANAIVAVADKLAEQSENERWASNLKFLREAPIDKAALIAWKIVK